MPADPDSPSSPAGVSPKLSVVMPAYRLGTTIHQNVHRVARALPGAEIVVVDDGSEDATGREAERAANELSGVKVLHHRVNQGKGRALITGAGAASGEVIVLLDGDLDLPPEQVPSLLPSLEVVDVVVGTKGGSMQTGNYPGIRRVLSRLYAFLIRLAFRLPVSETQTGLKIFRAKALKPLLPELRVAGYAFDLELLVRAARAGLNMKEVRVELSPGASSGAVLPRMLVDLGRDTVKIFWWSLRPQSEGNRSARRNTRSR